jgi:hypothetical protein
MRLKQYLSSIGSDYITEASVSNKITDEHRQQIEKILHNSSITRYTIRPDGIVDVSQHVVLRVGELDFANSDIQFGIIDGNFETTVDDTVTTLKGMPLEVYGNCTFNLKNLTSLQHSPTKVTGTLSYFNIPVGQVSTIDGITPSIGNLYLGPCFEDMSGIHRRIKKLTKEGVFILNTSNLKKGLTDIVLIRGITSLITTTLQSDIDKQLSTALEIVNKHIKSGDRSSIACANELDDAGLSAFI